MLCSKRLVVFAPSMNFTFQTAMSSTTKITANDVSHAEDEVRFWKKAWDRFKYRSVTNQEFSEAERHLLEGTAELQRFCTFAWRLTQFKFWLLLFVQFTGVAKQNWLVGGVIVGTAAVVLATVPLVLALKPDLVAILIGIVVCYIFAFSLTSAFLFSFRNTDTAGELGELRARLTTRANNLVILKGRLQEWKNHQKLLRQARISQVNYEDAIRQHKQLVDLLKSRRYQLVHTDWRSLRGVPFEDFVAEIFEELGYDVEKTKASGDQGVDLIVRGKGKVTAVQLKGYGGSVGNKAIQEVYAGKAFYQCNDCLAVTNSHFTSGAIKLARSVGCKLIDGQSIPELIDGGIY